MQVGDLLKLECSGVNIRHFYGIAFHVRFDPEFLQPATGSYVEAGEVLSSYPTQSTFAQIEGESAFVVGINIDESLNVADAPNFTDESLIFRVVDFLAAIKTGTTELTFEAYSVQRPDLKNISVDWDFPPALNILAQGKITLRIQEP